jgi:hypothetical protein
MEMTETFKYQLANGIRPEMREIAYPLSVDLADVGYSLSQNVARHLIAVLVPELSSFRSSTVDGCPGVGD